MAYSMPRKNDTGDTPEIVDLTDLVDGLGTAANTKPAEPRTVTLENFSNAPVPLAHDVTDPEVAQLKAQLRFLQDQLAKEQGRKDPEHELEAPPADGETIVIHVVANGFTALGQIWYVGQELEFDPRGKAYQDTVDKLGRSWLNLDENSQIDLYGEVKFRKGPWPGKNYADAVGAPLEFPLKPMRDGDPAILPPTQDELHAAARREQQRGRAVPRLTVR